MGAVSVEVLVVAGAGGVPVDHVYVVVAVDRVEHGAVGLAHPRLRAAGVHEEHLAAGPGRCHEFVDLLVGGRSVRAEGEHHHASHDILVVIVVERLLAGVQLAVHGGVDRAVGERLFELGDGAHRDRVADHKHVELGRPGRCVVDGQLGHLRGVGLLVLQQVGGADGGDGRHHDKADHGHDGHGRPR